MNDAFTFSDALLKIQQLQDEIKRLQSSVVLCPKCQNSDDAITEEIPSTPNQITIVGEDGKLYPLKKEN